MIPDGHYRGSPKAFCVVLLAMLVVIIAVDRISPAILPIDAYYFRPWEYMTGSNRFGLPRTNESVTMKSYGDLSNMLGVRSYRKYRIVTSTVDSRGHRNSPITQHDNPDIVIIGNSFMYGAGTTDDETFASQLQKRLPSKKVTAEVPVNISDFLRDERYIADPPPLVIWGRAERNTTIHDSELQKVLADTSCFQDTTEFEQFVADAKAIVKRAIKDVAEYVRLSIIRRNSQQLYQELRFRITGEHEPGAILAEGSDEIIFYAKSIRLVSQDAEARGLEDVARAVAHVQSCLEHRGTDLVFLTIPDKPHMYPTFLPEEYRASHDVDPLDTLHALLTEKGVVAVPLWPAFRDHALQGEDLYWPDDTHWNGEGIRIAVDELIKIAEER